MSIGVVYIGLLIAGVVYAVISGALGWLGDLGGGDVHVDMSGHLDAGHAHPISGTVVATFITGFGGGGTVAHYLFELPLGGSLSIAVVSGLALAAAAFGVLELIFSRRRPAPSSASDNGGDAEVITPIPETGMGEWPYRQGAWRGGRGGALARTRDRRRLVVIEKVIGPTLYVREKREGPSHFGLGNLGNPRSVPLVPSSSSS
jgi:hypothetical protein